MSREDYLRAYKLGRKDYQARMLRGERPTLEVLDYLLPARGTLPQVPLGLVQIPMAQIAGTKTDARSYSFSGSFMPILKEDTEFAQKWASLSTSHEQTGIQEPIKAYEYMNRFYVEEGNKRVSVLKFFGARSIAGEVTRILPPKSGELKNRIYYEFLDFYEVSKVNDIWFSKTGSFPALCQALGKEKGEIWSEDDRLAFRSLLTRFSSAYQELGGEKLSITTGDALLTFLSLYDYAEVCSWTTRHLTHQIQKSFEEFRLSEQPDGIELKLTPAQEKKSLFGTVIRGSQRKVTAAFLYEKTAASSAWAYAHELGRLHLSMQFPEEVDTRVYGRVRPQTTLDTIERAIEAGCDLIFTTTPAFVKGSVQAAIAHPKVRILNCSLYTSHRYIRTYYSRMHEVKFLLGAVAGSLAEHNRIFYLADAPIYGSIANINAFALGAQLVNPRAKIYLDWSSKKDLDIARQIQELQPDCISGKDMVIPEEASRYFGIYCLDQARPQGLAMPIWHWGKFYERLIRTILNGTWEKDDQPAMAKAINYWWGLSSGVVDVVCSKNLPSGTRRLVALLKQAISSGTFNPFAGTLYSQQGVVNLDPEAVLSPEAIITMDWLAENVIGQIPRKEDLREASLATYAQQGIHAQEE